MQPFGTFTGALPVAGALRRGLRRDGAPRRALVSATTPRPGAARRTADTRNVVDRYRYWRHEAIVADLDARRHPFHVAIENWQHDLNIGSVVRNANAFLAAEVHIVGQRRWNRRGAMVTDRYQHVRHHADARRSSPPGRRDDDLPVLGIDNLPGVVPIDAYELPERCVLLFGQEGPGLSDEAARAVRARCCTIRQFGSTRSINAAAASAVAMHEWISEVRRMSLPPGPTWPRAVQTLAWVTRPAPFLERCQRALRRRVHDHDRQGAAVGRARAPGRRAGGLHRRPRRSSAPARAT